MYCFKKTIIVSVFVFLIAAASSFSLGASEPFLVIDAESNLNKKYPMSFRSTNQINKLPSFLSRKGLLSLHILAGGEFTKKQLLNLKKTFPHLLYVVDLRQESHGYVNGIPVSWYANYNSLNLFKTNYEVEQIQAKLFSQLIEKQNKVTLFKRYQDANIVKYVPDRKILPKDFISEKKMVENLQLKYYRFYVTDTFPPRDIEVDRFVSFVNKLPEGSVVYFHCAAGFGRTTTFMSMLDMMKNSTDVAFGDILLRQQFLGGSVLKDSAIQTEHGRYHFLQNFYRFAKQYKNDYSLSWTKWCMTNCN